jgi:hypothetical protein
MGVGGRERFEPPATGDADVAELLRSLGRCVRASGEKPAEVSRKLASAEASGAGEVDPDRLGAALFAPVFRDSCHGTCYNGR